MQRLALAVSTVFGLGYFPVAPGTMGSLAGLALYPALRATGSPIVEVVAVVVVFAAGAWSATIAERHFGGVDPGPVVVDEVLGMQITLLFVPAGWGAAIAGFALFRLFDIVKPYPARRFERLHGGLGVMSDDAMAAVYANITLRLIVWMGWVA